MVGNSTILAARYLDLLSVSQRVTASNVANADTPGYRTLGFDFQAELRSALDDPKNAPRAEPHIREVGGLPVKNDGNDVNVERELRALSENAIRFSHALLSLRGGIRSIRDAIHEGRGA